MGDERRLEPFGELIMQAPAFTIFLIPLRLVSRNLWFVRRHFAEDQLADRKNGEPHVAHQTHVEFTALDVFLRDRVAGIFLVNKGDPLAELLVVLDERCPRNAVGCLFFDRLNQDWKLELPGPCDALAARNDHEVRHMDAVIVENLFRDTLVLAKSKTSRATAGKGKVLHFEKGNDVLIESGIVLELFDQVEKNIGREGFQFLPEKIDIVKNGEMLRRVAKRAERGHDVRLSLPILRFHFLAEVLIDGGGTCAVEKDEDFEFLFHVIWCA